MVTLSALINNKSFLVLCLILAGMIDLVTELLTSVRVRRPSEGALSRLVDEAAVFSSSRRVF